MTEPTTPNLTTAQEITDAIRSRYNAQDACADVNKLLAEWRKKQSEGQADAELYKPICDILKISNDMHAEAELLESKCNP